MDFKKYHELLIREIAAARTMPPAALLRRFGPASFAVLAVAFLGIVLIHGCSKTPEEKQAAQAALVAQTTGRLVVKSNRANTSLEATRLAAPGEAASVGIKGSEDGAAEQTLAGLPPGKYAVLARTEGWSDLRQEVTVDAGRTTEVAFSFKSGSLRLDSDPTGASGRSKVSDSPAK